MQKFLYLVLAALFALPATAFAVSQEDAMISELTKQIGELSEELDELNDRVDVAERHATLDRIEFTGDMRTKVNSLHYNDVTFNPGVNVDFADFFQNAEEGMLSASGGDLGTFNPLFDPANPGSPLEVMFANLQNNDIDAFNGLNENFYNDFFTKTAAGMMGVDAGLGTMSPTFDPASMVPDPTSSLENLFENIYNTDPAAFGQIMTNFSNWMGAGSPGAPPVGVFRMATAPKTSDINNDILFTTRLRLNMKAKVWDNVKFSGRLSVFKNWGDSTGSKVFDSWNSFTMDGTNGSNTTGDMLRLDRAYFDWSNIGDSGFYLSIGRRPSTDGPPTQYRENEMRGGTPTGNVMDLNFDGITVGYNLEELTGIEGMVARFCYGQGYESEWGNGEMFNEIQTKDTHFGGFNVDLLNDGTNFLQVTAFRAMDINDGFKGIIAFPTQYAALFAPTLYQDMQKFPTFNFVTRYQPSTVIGDIDLGGIVFAREEENGINWFASAGMTFMRPSGNAGMFGGMGTDAVFEAELNSTGTEVIMVPKHATDADDQDGYGFYAGVQIPAPMGKVGFEYNYGSEYWTPFTQGQDDAMGSKIATRGHVGEAYYIFDVNPRMSIKLAGIYYDYEYTGSGSPVGQPQKIDDIKAGTAYSLMPVVDTAYDLNASVSMKF